MTPKQKRNIGHGVRLARIRKRRSLAMKASWIRRRNKAAAATECRKYDDEMSQPNACVDLIRRDVFPTGQNANILGDNPTTVFSQIETLAALWQELEHNKWRTTAAPQLTPIIQGAIDRVRLEIILAVHQHINTDEHTLD